MSKIQGKVRRADVADLVETFGSNFFSADVIKADGTPRRITGRIGVHKYTKSGRADAIVQSSGVYPNIIVWEIGGPDGEGKYRTISIDRLIRLSIKGFDLTVI